MARNLLDDDDWDHLASVVRTELANQTKALKSGPLTELADQGSRAEAALAEIAQQGSVVRDSLNAAIADVTADRTTIQTLQGAIGSGLLDADKQRQVNLLFAEIEQNFDARIEHLQGTRRAAEPKGE